MEEKSIYSVELHPITETHPVMSTEQFSAFVEDIAKNGQLEPVKLYRGKIVDGRHRYKALKQLGITTIKVDTLGNNLTLDEVRDLVNSTEIRRHQTPTQLAIKAYRLYTSKSVKQAEAVKMIGCSLTNLKYVVELEKLGRLDIIELLESGRKYNVSTDSRYTKPTDSLSAIIVKVKAEKAKLEAMQSIGTDSLDTKEVKTKFTTSEMNTINAIGLMTSSCTDVMKRTIIANLYASMSIEEE